MPGGYWAGLLVALPLLANRILQAVGWSVFYLADPCWQWILCTVVQGLAGRSYYARAVQGSRADLAVILPGLVLYLYSLGAAVVMQCEGRRLPLLFDASAVALLLTGAVAAVGNRHLG